MTWTYDPNIDTPLDRVRFLIGDTNTNARLFSDEEIRAILAAEPDTESAAVELLLSLAARLSTLVDKSVGDLRISYSQRAANYRQMAKDLATRSAAGTGSIPVPYAGGISKADKETRRRNNDRVTPGFAKGAMDLEGGYNRSNSAGIPP